jgi:DNA-damage-inducible protein J
MAESAMVHVRVDQDLKNQAAETLASMGLTVSDAVRVFLTRVVTDQQLPFALQAPNPSTRAAMREARAMGRARHASARSLVDELEKANKR